MAGKKRHPGQREEARQAVMGMIAELVAAWVVLGLCLAAAVAMKLVL
jgi:hypothetical protein